MSPQKEGKGRYASTALRLITPRRGTVPSAHSVLWAVWADPSRGICSAGTL